MYRSNHYILVQPCKSFVTWRVIESAKPCEVQPCKSLVLWRVIKLAKAGRVFAQFINQKFVWLFEEVKSPSLISDQPVRRATESTNVLSINECIEKLYCQTMLSHSAAQQPNIRVNNMWLTDCPVIVWSVGRASTWFPKPNCRLFNSWVKGKRRKFLIDYSIRIMKLFPKN